MRRHGHPNKYPLTALVLLVALVIASNSILYFFLTKDYNAKLMILSERLSQQTESLSSEIAVARVSLLKTIEEEHTYTEQQRLLLENATLENFKRLEDYINDETSTLQLNLESQLRDVDTKVGGLEKKSTELEKRIDNINVRSADFSNVIKDVVKTVVSIKTDKTQASGVFFDARGYIMTNRHVVDGAQKITAVDHNLKSYPVRIVATADDADLAVLKVEGNKTFEYLKFEKAGEVNVGERVIAVGNPLGLSFSVTEGIVSALNRKIDKTGIGYVQTDVPINRGNSGGPLINSAKRIVGINTLKIAAGEGLGFAIPSDVAQEFAEQALEDEEG